VAYAAQFPNFFYGNVTVFDYNTKQWHPAEEGMTVTAVVDKGLATERHYTLPTAPVGKYGLGPWLGKMQVGGDNQGDIADLSPVEFYVTDGPLPLNPPIFKGAGFTVFHVDGDPDGTELHLFPVINWPVGDPSTW
jgi:hypothetical protein